MELYFLKSAACLAVLLVFYKLLLEKEDMHQFNRFYLLFSVVISFTVPLISFTTYVEVPAEPVMADTSYSYLLPPPPPPAKTPLPIWPSLLWGIYGVGVIFFSWKFGKNLKELVLRIKRNTKLKVGSVTNVLLREDIIPHTFLDYIFLNKKKFEEHAIPQEVFEHEQAHAQQKHSYDILFMELLQIIFWFHPLLYLVKRAIKLNHEFLADKSVLKKGANTAAYQQTLLAFSSNDLNSSLVNPINYSFIKKRFTVMKTQTSKKAIWLRSLLVLPIVAALLYGFSTQEIEKREIQKPASEDALEIRVNQEGNILLNDKEVTLESLGEEIEASNPSEMSIKASMEASEPLLQRVINTAVGLNSSGCISFSPIGDDPEKANQLADMFAIATGKEPATPEMIAEYNKLVEYYNSQENPIIKSVDLERIHFLKTAMIPSQFAEATKIEFKLPPASPERVAEYNRLAKAYKAGEDLNAEEFNNMHVNYNFLNLEQREKAESFPEMTVVEIPEEQQKISEELIAEYNKMAKKYNSQEGETSLIPQDDMVRMKSIYNLMTPEQKKNAEPLPEPEIIEVVGYGEVSPEQKKNPDPDREIIEVIGQEIATPEMVKEYNEIAKMLKEYNKRSNNGETLPKDMFVIKMKDVDRMRYLHSIMTEEQKKRSEPMPGLYPPPPPPPPAPSLEEYNPDVTEPPSPPSPPPAPLEHLKELAAEGARFFIKGEKEISANEALDLVSGGQKVRVEVTEYDSVTTVHLTLKE